MSETERACAIREAHKLLDRIEANLRKIVEAAVRKSEVSNGNV